VRFQLKFTLALAGAILTGLTLFGAFAVRWSEEKVIETELERGKRTADTAILVVTVIDWILERQAGLLAGDDLLAGELASDHADPDTMTQVLTATIRADEIVASASIIDRAGLIVASTEPDLVGLPTTETPASFGQTPDLDTLVTPNGQLVVGDLHLGLVAFAAVEVDGRPVGVAQVAFEPALIEAVLRNQQFNETGGLLLGLRDPDGAMRMVGLGDSGVEITRLPQSSSSSDHPMIAALNGETVDNANAHFEGSDEPAIVVARPAPDIGVAVVSRVNRAEIVAQVGDIRNALLLVGAALTSAAVVAGLILSRRLAVHLAERERAEAQFTSMFTSAPMAMLAVGSDGQISLANERAADLLGYQVGQLQGMDVESLVPPDSRDRHVGPGHGFAETRESWTMRPGQDMVAVAAGGREIPVEMSLTPIDAGDRQLIIAALVDLTERKHAEQALADRAEALARSNRDLDDFAYVAAHDLKSPLRAMEILTSFVLEDSGDSLPEEARNDLIQVVDRSKMQTGMLDGLLQYARIGRALGQPTEVDPGEILDDLIPAFLPAGQFEVDILDPLPRIFAPKPAVELVLRNLLMNAAKHHDRPTGRITVTGAAHDDCVHLAFADDGPGIPPEHEAKVFQLFGTLNHRDENQSSGLGLALIKRTIESSGGSVNLRPNDGRGTTFEVRWPLASQPPSSSAGSVNLPPTSNEVAIR
jgi:PAS domain S-box-containing protein